MKLSKFILYSPFTYLLIEITVIEFLWGIDRLNEFTTLQSTLIILAVVLIPMTISLGLGVITKQIK